MAYFASLTFTQGLLLGQLSIIVLVALVVRHVIFEQPSASPPRPREPRRPRSTSTSKPVIAHVPDILPQLGFDLATHPPESTDWLNVLVAQALVAYRSLLHGDDDPATTNPDGTKNPTERSKRARDTIEEALNYKRPTNPSAEGFISVDYITVTEADLGSSSPRLTDARVRPADETGRIRIEVEVEYDDCIRLGVDTRVFVNFPKPRFAMLPVSLGLMLTSFSATVMLEIPPASVPDANGQPAPSALLSLAPDFHFSLSTTSLLGSRAKLTDIPKLEQLVLSRVRGWIVDHLVWPRVRVLRLPGVGRRGEVEDEGAGEGEYVWVEGVPQSLEPIVVPSSPLLKTPGDSNVLSETDDDEEVVYSKRNDFLKPPLSSHSNAIDDDSDDADETMSVPGHLLPPFTSRQASSPQTRPRKPSFGAHLGLGSSPRRKANGVSSLHPAPTRPSLNPTSSSSRSNAHPTWSTSGLGLGPASSTSTSFANSLSGIKKRPAPPPTTFNFKPLDSSSTLPSSPRPPLMGHSSSMSMSSSAYGVGYGIRERVREARQAAALKEANGVSDVRHYSDSRKPSGEWIRDLAGPAL